jgi:dienelactone hydrolase
MPADLCRQFVSLVHATGFHHMMRTALFVLLSIVAAPLRAQTDDVLPGTKPLTDNGGLSVWMLDGIHKFVEQKIDESVAKRAAHWQRDFSSPEAYERSLQPNRERLLKIIGAVDPRVPVRMERFGDDDNPALVAETDRFQVFQVRWPVLDGVTGEGLLLEPKGEPVASVVAIPDADQTPEQLVGLAPGIAAASQFARRLANSGLRVVVPTLISRGNEFSGVPEIAMTNQPHREWIYRQAFQMGRHVIGYEVQKVQAAVEWLKQTAPDARVGVAGYGEGGLIALYAAAVETRIDAVLVSGYFDSRQKLWTEPIYRNVWGLLHEFGDAELASLIAPRGLVIEYSVAPQWDGPPSVTKGRRAGAAVGTLKTPEGASVEREFNRVRQFVGPIDQSRILIRGTGNVPVPFGFEPVLQNLLQRLDVDAPLELAEEAPVDQRKSFDPASRQQRQVEELVNHVQRLLAHADRTRDRFVLNNTTLIRTLAPRGERFRMFRVKEQSAEVFEKEVAPLRQILYDDVIGRIDEPFLPIHARSRKTYDNPKWTGYDVVMDVFPGVFFWGVLLVPKDMQPGETRPVVVCQHGRNGLPKDVIEGDLPAYHDFAAKLAERGFITFAPHNLYRGEDLYRMINRKGNPIKLSMFSFITAQHEQLLNWLETLPFVDKNRIAFYGLSYGGETAVRVPALLPRYCLSICSGDFNDWARKVAGIDRDLCFPFTIEWEMPYFNMGNTFNYAELTYLIFPRPFMVERGHHDGVAPDEWVAAEYAKVRWLYAQMGLAERTEIEFFNGGHTINGAGTFDFLHNHLNWPKPK